MALELQPMEKEALRPEGLSHNNNDETDEGEVHPGNGNPPESGAPEQKPLLQPAQEVERNGEHTAVRVESDGASEEKPKVLKRLKKELNEKVVWEIKLWMAIIIILIIILCMVLLLVFLCSGQQEDADDKYDVSSFVLPLSFNGSFRLANRSYVHELDESNLNDLFIILEQQMTDIYKSSHALERFFNHASIKTLRPDNASFQYELTFRMPEEGHEELKQYTLSREMVYYVFLQHLLDQEDAENPLYIQPSSLNMERMEN